MLGLFHDLFENEDYKLSKKNLASKNMTINTFYLKVCR